MTPQLLLFCLLAARPGAAQEYYEPVARGKREIATLQKALDEVQRKIDDVKAAIAKDAEGFYRAHEADCVVKGPKRADGSFDYVYKPADEWKEKKKRLKPLIADKEKALLAAYGTAISQLEARIALLKGRRGHWGVSLKKLKAVEKDLDALESEWRKASFMAGWEAVNDFLGAFQKGMDVKLAKLNEAVPGSVWSKMTTANRGKLAKAIESFNRVSGIGMEATKMAMETGELVEEKKSEQEKLDALVTATEQSKHLMEIVGECVSATENLTKAESEELDAIRGAATLAISLTQGAVRLGPGGGWDDKSKEQFRTAARDAIKLIGVFCPLVALGEKVEALGEAAFEFTLAAGTLWKVDCAGDFNQENLEKARAAVEGLDRDINAACRKMDQYSLEKIDLERKIGGKK